MTITVELPVVEGEVIDQALSKAMEAHASNNAEFESTSFAAQQADALVNMAKSYLRGADTSQSRSSDHYQVVIHVDETALSKNEGRSDVPLQTAKRLTCDGSTVTMIDNAKGEPLSIGRKTQTVPTAMTRALWAKDRGCTLPRLHHTRYVDAHHVVHWANGGETSLHNLILLCTKHHRLVHEDGYEIRKDFKGNWYFRRPDGRAIPEVGFIPDDIIDDDIGNLTSSNYPNTTAAGPGLKVAETSSNPVRDTTGEYRVSSDIKPNTRTRHSMLALPTPPRRDWAETPDGRSFPRTFHHQ